MTLGKELNFYSFSEIFQHLSFLNNLMFTNICCSFGSTIDLTNFQTYLSAFGGSKIIIMLFHLFVDLLIIYFI